MDDSDDRGDTDLAGVTLQWDGKGPPVEAALRDRVRPVWEGEPASPGDGLLLRADAHEAAAWLAPDLAGTVDLVYIDPPFAVGMDFDASVRTAEGTRPQFAYCDRWPTTEAYLNFLHHLIVLAHRLLAADGSLYLHVDRRTSHWARCILAEVFGPNRDRGSIVWHLGNGVKSKSAWGCSHNDILCFSKGASFKFRTDSPAMREPFAASSLGTHFRSVDDDGRRYRDRTVNGKVYRYYADEGRLVGSVWTDCPSMSARSPIMNEATGFPTQKPEKLLERIIEASSEPNDLVMDLCCGSGTTPAVAHRLGRRWIAADIGRLAIERTAARLRERDAAVPVHVVDLVPREPNPAARMAALLGIRQPEPTVDAGLRGRVDGRAVAVWPHGVVVTAAMLGDTFSGRPGAAFATAFDATDESPADVSRWRYLPETASAASLRSVRFASVAGGKILEIDTSPEGRRGNWSPRPLDQSELGPVTAGRVVDVFGFTHTLEDLERAPAPHAPAAGAD